LCSTALSLLGFTVELCSPLKEVHEDLENRLNFMGSQETKKEWDVSKVLMTRELVGYRVSSLSC
jgi:hypothetical protein